MIGNISKKERGHALMEITLKSKALLIDSGASNHMMASKYSFSSLNTDKRIPIHMGDDSTIISEGQGTVDLEHVLSTQMALLRPSADTSYVGTQKDIYGLKVA